MAGPGVLRPDLRSLRAFAEQAEHAEAVRGGLTAVQMRERPGKLRAILTSEPGVAASLAV